MKLLLLLVSPLLARLPATTTVTGAVTEVAIDQPMRLDPKVTLKWASIGDFTGYHHLAKVTDPEEICKRKESSYTTVNCFTLQNTTYKFTAPLLVKPGTRCPPSETCSISPTQRSGLKLIEKDPLDFLKPFIPSPLNYAKSARTKRDVSFSFAGPSKASIWFTPICLRLKGKFIYKYNHTFRTITETSTVAFCIPVTLDDGSLDSIYELRYE
ncbi:hypothetical protein DSO57_1019371 [Entomophthora muscae]|uniref:Uncharacterized protein n=1 Tax=Entomophthora muscae TaxID=34485 RepID=A0ACC2SSV9_9FUNG|nr:hypothetical protein DSO57_1019371 [Entomophthora muscae]